jgi:hypothetical protein
MGRIRLASALVVLVASGALTATPAEAARVQVGRLVLEADGGFTPRLLPKRSFAPIDFAGHADIATTDGSLPPALQHVQLEFDRDGRLTTAGLPACPPSRLEGTATAQARQLCAGAIVGRGHIGATVGVPGLARVVERSPLTLFNGPRVEGKPTVVMHAQSTFPLPETYVIVVRIERRHGPYAYRASFDVPPIADGFGVLTHIDARIGRRFRSGGVERSYASARCSDYILQTRGFFSFADGTVVSGSVFKPCRPLP